MSHLAGWNRHSVRAAAVAVLTTVLLAPAALASPITFVSPLSPEAPGATGSGFVTVVFDGDANQLRIEADWTGLSGTTTVAHIHCCTTEAFTGVAPPAISLVDFPTMVTAGEYTHTFDLGDPAVWDPAFLASFGGTASGASSALLAAMDANQAYLNIHTAEYPNGEIRGFVVAAPIPEPATWGMLGIGLAGLAVMARRRPSPVK